LYVRNSIEGTDTLLIIVSDHGQTEAERSKQIFVEDIPGLKECLTIPIAGEPRCRDCFVRPSKAKEFEGIVKNKMRKYCWCFKGQDLINKNFIGRGKIKSEISCIFKGFI
jgi:hypothetical protein